MNIYLIRHGELCWEDNIKKCIGITDINLNENGIKQANQTGVFLKDKNIKKIYTSNLSRCIESANIIANILKVPYCIENNLIEINMGVWENKSFDYIKSNHASEYEERGKSISTFRIKNAETFEECYERSKNIFNKLSKENYDHNIAIIGHSGFIKSIICYINNMNLDDILSIKLKYGHIISIVYNENVYKII